MLLRGMGRGSKRNMIWLEALVRRLFAWYVVMKGLVTKTDREEEVRDSISPDLALLTRVPSAGNRSRGLTTPQ